MHLLPKVSLVLLIVIASSVEGRSSPSLHSSFERYVQMLETINNSPILQEEWKKHVALSREDPVMSAIRRMHTSKLQLNCPGEYRSDVRPTSVHALKVGDIDVIAAMGDSLTAGNGVRAWTIFGCLIEYRGRSWSIGGDKSYGDGVTTLPNIMRLFNPALKGFSVGFGGVNSRGSALNVAEAGDVAQDMPQQARNLVDKMRRDGSIDFENDWKMVTLFIGGNNLCAFCKDLTAHSAETYKSNIAEALDILKNELPRTFVNLIEIFDISPIVGLSDGLICNLVHCAVCSCGHGANADKAALTDLSVAYQRVVRELVDSGRYDNKEDFTVVVQPFYRETAPPTRSNGDADMSYFAPDCFHFSEKGQNAAGKALWNSLVTPSGHKSVDWELSSGVVCPSENDLSLSIPGEGTAFITHDIYKNSISLIAWLHYMLQPGS